MPNDLLLLLGLLGIAQVEKGRADLRDEKARSELMPIEKDLATWEKIAAWWPDEEDE